MENDIPGGSKFLQSLLASKSTYLIPSLISCVFCLIPGIIAVYYSFQVRTYKQTSETLTPEQIAEAIVASGKARFFMIIAFVIGVVGIAVQLYRG